MVFRSLPETGTQDEPRPGLGRGHQFEQRLVDAAQFLGAEMAEVDVLQVPALVAERREMPDRLQQVRVPQLAVAQQVGRRAAVAVRGAGSEVQPAERGQADLGQPIVRAQARRARRRACATGRCGGPRPGAPAIRRSRPVEKYRSYRCDRFGRRTRDRAARLGPRRRTGRPVGRRAAAVRDAGRPSRLAPSRSPRARDSCKRGVRRKESGAEDVQGLLDAVTQAVAGPGAFVDA